MPADDSEPDRPPQRPQRRTSTAARGEAPQNSAGQEVDLFAEGGACTTLEPLAPPSRAAQAPREASATPPGAVEELVDLYDDAGQVVGRAPRSRVRTENLPHAGTGVVVRNSRGEIYVHRRTDTKDVFPGCYDLAAGGVVAAGEDPDEAAVREAAEELGVHGVPLRRLGVTRYADEHTTYLAFLYETVYDGPITHQPSEVAWGTWMTPEQVLERLDDPAWPFVPDSRALLADRVGAWARDAADR